MKISVCIATYNGEKYIKEQLASILCQLKENDEVIISDDCSTDNTLPIIRSINDNRVVVLEGLEKFKNHNFNFENALARASGDIVFLADQDDVWINNKVEKFLEKFENNGSNLVISDCILVNSQKSIISDSYFKIRKSGKGFWKNFHKNTYVGCCMAFDRKILEASLPFPQDTFSHDTWIGLIGEMTGKTEFINDRLIYFRRHGENFSAYNFGDSFLTNKSSYTFYGSIKLRVILIKMLILRFMKLQIHKLNV